MNQLETPIMPSLQQGLEYSLDELIASNDLKNLDQVKDWLKEEKETILLHETAWVDSLEEKLFQAYLSLGQLEKAREVAEGSMNEQSRARRLKRLQN